MGTFKLSNQIAQFVVNMFHTNLLGNELHLLKGTEAYTLQRWEWIMPKFQKDMGYFPMQIDFTSANVW